MDLPWIYQKIFIDSGADEAADDVLLRYVSPTAETLMARGWVDRFFFLRYGEGGYHLRYRLRLVGTTDPALVRAFLQQAAPTSLRQEPAEYEPEVEKYGGPAGLELCERMFCASSQFTLACIGRTIGRNNLRVIVAIVAFDALLRTGHIADSARLDLLRDYARYWDIVSTKWTGSGTRSRIELDAQFISWLAELLASPEGTLNVLADHVGSGYALWAATLRVHMTELYDLARERRLTTSRVQILCNLAHTQHNRLGLGLHDEVLIATLLEAAGGLEASHGTEKRNVHGT